MRVHPSNHKSIWTTLPSISPYWIACDSTHKLGYHIRKLYVLSATKSIQNRVGKRNLCTGPRINTFLPEIISHERRNRMDVPGKDCFPVARNVLACSIHTSKKDVNHGSTFFMQQLQAGPSLAKAVDAQLGSAPPAQVLPNRASAMGRQGF